MPTRPYFGKQRRATCVTNWPPPNDATPDKAPVNQKKIIMRQCDALAPPGSAENLKSIASKV